MSLINDALKKAARQRTGDGGSLSNLMPGGRGSAARRMGTGTLVLIGAGALALIAISAVITGMLVSGRSKPPTDEAKPAVATLTQAPTAVPTAAPAAVVAMPQPTAVPTSPPVVAVPTAAPAIKVALPAAAPAPGSDAVQALVDALQVSGVRTAGSGSKALVDGHVYRLNELVDRASGLRLTKIDPDHLTFVDSSGAVYVKNF